jgi:hypothetical protein
LGCSYPRPPVPAVFFAAQPSSPPISFTLISLSRLALTPRAAAAHYTPQPSPATPSHHVPRRPHPRPMVRTPSLTLPSPVEADPSPWVILNDFGGAFSMGAIGGGIWHGIKGARNSPKVRCAGECRGCGGKVVGHVGCEVGCGGAAWRGRRRLLSLACGSAVITSMPLPLPREGRHGAGVLTPLAPPPYNRPAPNRDLPSPSFGEAPLASIRPR